MAGYSPTPLLKKLGIKPGYKVWFLHAPENYQTLLGPLPEGVAQIEKRDEACHFVHFFTQTQAELRLWFPILQQTITKDGMIWISWPKKAAKLSGDLDGNIVREIGLANGLVDVKVAAIDEVWSGLKFVYRLLDRVPL